jgi:hypothetical protein
LPAEDLSQQAESGRGDSNPRSTTLALHSAVPDVEGDEIGVRSTGDASVELR